MAKSLHQIISDLADRLSPAVRDAFLASVANVTNEVILKDLITAIEAGNYQQAFRTLGMSQAALRPVTAALENVFDTGGISTGQTFPSVLNTNVGRTVFRFDFLNERAQNWLKQQSSSLVTLISEDARINIMNVMQIAVDNGTNPRTTALDIVGRINVTTGKREGGLIGLNQQQELSVRNARYELESLNANYFQRKRRDKRFDAIVRKAMIDKKSLDKDTVDRLISRYKDKLLQLRGETIARTETIHALNRSQHEAILQANDMGAIGRDGVTREWDTSGDRRVRHSHREMDGQTVGIDEPFKTPRGNLLMFPGDTSLGADADETIGCRCKFKVKIDWFSQVD